MNKIGVYAGSFCPVTKGHVNAIERAARIVDKLYVVIGVNSNKKYAISVQDRQRLLKYALENVNNAEIVVYDGMMTDFCRQVNADIMVKSVRNATDLQEVIDLASINRRFWNGETVFLTSDERYEHLSSSLVRELVKLQRDITPFVPEGLANEITELLKQNDKQN
ncbi:MAG: pantetheine-phosphate adenylyltransferase [Corallococcus sp.]|nr:pantetheine-phosphate adenylyltransferase [Corallococcus sp.]